MTIAKCGYASYTGLCIHQIILFPNTTFVTEFAAYLESVVLGAEPSLICGDFNMHVDVCEKFRQDSARSVLQFKPIWTR